MIYLVIHLDGIAFSLEALHLLKITKLKNNIDTYAKTLLLCLELDDLAKAAWRPAFVFLVLLVFYNT